MSSRLSLSFPEFGRYSGEQQTDPCNICLNHHTHFSKPSQWKSEKARALVVSLQVPIDAKVCQPWRRDVNRVITDTDFIPRWEKGKDKVKYSELYI